MSALSKSFPPADYPPLGRPSLDQERAEAEITYGAWKNGQHIDEELWRRTQIVMSLLATVDARDAEIERLSKHHEGKICCLIEWTRWQGEATTLKGLLREALADHGERHPECDCAWAAEASALLMEPATKP